MSISAASLVLILVVAQLCWSYAISPVDRVFLEMLFGIGSMGGQ